MANVSNFVQKIRNAILGEEVRESIAAGIEAVNTEVVSTTGRQTTLENTFAQVREEMTRRDPSGAEVVQARTSDTGVSYSALGERLKAERVDGGTNLLRSTALKKNMDYMNVWTISSSVWHVSDDTTGITPHRNRSFRGDVVDSTAYYGVHNALHLQENTTYTMSCWVAFDYSCADDEGIVIQISCKDRNSNYYYATKPLRARDTTKGKWVRLVHTFTTKDLLPDTLSDFCVQTDKRKFHGYVGDFKLELGSHATDWSPNPQDYVLWSNPIGNIIMNNGVDPSTTIGGIWEQTCKGRKPVGVGEVADSNGLKKTYTVGETGGELKHKQTEEEGFPHTHGQVVSDENGGVVHGGRTDFTRDNNAGMSVYTQGIQTDSAGGGQAFNIVDPYQAFYFWKRTA